MSSMKLTLMQDFNPICIYMGEMLFTLLGLIFKAEAWTLCIGLQPEGLHIYNKDKRRKELYFYTFSFNTSAKVQ